MKKNIGVLSSKGLICIHKKETMQQAFNLMKNISSRHLPVIDDDGAVVGMLSDRDIQRAMQNPQIEGWSALPVQPKFNPDDLVQEFMSWPIQTVDESFSIGQTAELLIEKKISSLVITKGEIAIGIVTTEDLLRVLVQEHQNFLNTVKENISGLIYRSPIGSIIHSLSNAGI